MNQKDTLIPYIKGQINQGVPAETIKQQLLAQGWESSVVDESMREAMQSQEVPQPQEAIQPQIITSEPTDTASPVVRAEPVAHLQFGLREAFSDAYHAIKANLVGISLLAIISLVIIFIAFIIVGLILWILLASILTQVFGNLVGTLLFAGELNTPPLLFFGTALVLYLIFLVLGSILYSFPLAVIGLAANDGVEGKKSAIGETIKIAASRIVKMSSALILYYLLFAAPVILTFLSIFVMIPLPGFAFIAFLLMIISLVAMIYLGVKFCLMPFIPVIEPDLSVRQFISRTNQLMKGGGSWFAAKFFAILVVIAIISSVFQPNTNNSSALIELLYFLLSFAFGIFYITVMIVFYRNRKAIKD